MTFYDFETGGKTLSRTGIPIQLGYGTKHKQEEAFISPFLFENPNTPGKNFVQEDVMELVNGKWEWKGDFKGAYEIHKIEAGIFAEGSKAKGVLNTKEEVAALLKRGFNGPLVGFNSNTFDVFQFGHLLGVNNPEIRKQVSHLIQKEDKVAMRELVERELGNKQIDVYEEFRALTKGNKHFEGAGKATNERLAGFFGDVDHAGDLKGGQTHNAMYDIYMTSVVKEGVDELKSDIDILKNGSVRQLKQFKQDRAGSHVYKKEFAEQLSYELKRLDGLKLNAGDKLVNTLQHHKKLGAVAGAVAVGLAAGAVVLNGIRGNQAELAEKQAKFDEQLYGSEGGTYL